MTDAEVAILRAMRWNGRLSIRQIARDADIGERHAHAILMAFHERELVWRNSYDGRWQIGPKGILAIASREALR